MIIIYHTYDGVETVVSSEGKPLDSYKGSIKSVLFEIARAYPSSIICWCDQAFKEYLDYKKIEKHFVHNNMMISCSSISKNYLPEEVHYVEESPFMKIHKKVMYPTWLMSADAGAIHAQVLNQASSILSKGEPFEYLLNSIAKTFQSQGLFCYQIPLIKSNARGIRQRNPKKQASIQLVYRFVKQHYKAKWVFFLFIAQILFEKKWNVSALVSSLFVNRRSLIYKPAPFDQPEKTIKTSTDVIIPTMGRAAYLKDVLYDLKSQTKPPKRVIIVEQNPDPKSVSELEYISSKSWPFEIKHTFIHETGACNARNIALSQTTADWVFFADDDVRFERDLLENSLKALESTKASCIAMSVLQKGEKKVFTKTKQWISFPSGASIVRGSLSRKLQFNTSFEHGYGEDADYGMQLRNEGCDIIYYPDLELRHLKAPIGGFRNKVTQPWEQEKRSPKPSPTVMLYRLLHTTDFQRKGYKLRLFLRQIKKVSLLKKFSFHKKFIKQWDTSIKWANQLVDK